MNVKRATKVLQAKYPGILLIRGKGYYYITSDQEELGLKIAGLYTSSIPVFNIKNVSDETIIRWVDDLFKDDQIYSDNQDER